MISKTINFKYDIGSTFYYKINNVIHYGIIVGVRIDYEYGWTGGSWTDLQKKANNKEERKGYMRYLVLDEKGRTQYLEEKTLEANILPDNKEALIKAFVL